MTLKIGVPSKGRLMEKTFDWFGARGLIMRQSGEGREYAGEVAGLDGIELVLLSAAEIPRELSAGRIHLGVTGSDLVRDKLADWDRQVAELAPLGFGQADLIIAVPAVWIDVDTLDDLDAAAAAFRAVHGHRMRIATKYHRLVRDFLTAQGIADYQLVDSQGATEGTVKNLTAEAIADITSTGETLRANHLKVLSDGLVHRSQATLYAARAADWQGPPAGTLRLLVARLGLEPPTGFFSGEIPHGGRGV
jgi:ATP phosphoribosyltransferase